MSQKKPPHDASTGPLSVSKSVTAHLATEGQNMHLVTEGQNMPPIGFTERGSASGSAKAHLATEGQNMRLVTEGQNMPPSGFTERGSASTSARAPWRWARATRPGGGISGPTTAATATTTTTRGYQKLEGAARAFGFDFRGKTVLDIGSSTGGFTKYALDRGAQHIIAVEKGTNQMEKPLRFDPRIDLYEKTDIFTFRLNPRDLPDIIVADVSFLSLTKVLKYAKLHLSRSDTDFLVMLKPQFEASPRQLSRGVVKNETIRREILKHFESWLGQHGFFIVKKHDNTLAGKNGNLERFYWLRLAKNDNLRLAKKP